MSTEFSLEDLKNKLGGKIIGKHIKNLKLPPNPDLLGVDIDITSLDNSDLPLPESLRKRASQCDITVSSLYCDGKKIYDYGNGINALKHGIITYPEDRNAVVTDFYPFFRIPRYLAKSSRFQLSKHLKEILESPPRSIDWATLNPCRNFQVLSRLLLSPNGLQQYDFAIQHNLFSNLFLNHPLPEPETANAKIIHELQRMLINFFTSLTTEHPFRMQFNNLLKHYNKLNEPELELYKHIFVCVFRDYLTKKPDKINWCINAMNGILKIPGCKYQTEQLKEKMHDDLLLETSPLMQLCC